MKKDGKINYKLLAKMFPQAYKHIGLEMLDQCRTGIGKYQFVEISILILIWCNYIASYLIIKNIKKYINAIIL